MGSFRDDGFNQGDAAGWDNAEHPENTIRHTVESFTLDRQAGQDKPLILWCEAQGIVPQLERVAHQYSVSVYSSGGCDSLMAKHDVTRRISQQGDTVEIVHIGDHDPSSVHMFGSLDEDVKAFASHYAGSVMFACLAVTPTQVETYLLPTAPAKTTAALAA